MSWTVIRPYFNAILETKEYREWPDAFAVDNIPDNVLDKSYHVSIGLIAGIRQNQLDQETEVEVVVRTFHKGYANPQEAIDFAISETESIMKECVKVSDVGGRVSTAGILNVVFNEAAFDPLDASNDNSIVVTSTYTVRVIVCVNEI